LPAGNRPVNGTRCQTKHPSVLTSLMPDSAHLTCIATGPTAPMPARLRSVPRARLAQRMRASVKFLQPPYSSTGTGLRAASEERASQRAPPRAPSAISSRRRGTRASCGTECSRGPATRDALRIPATRLKRWARRSNRFSESVVRRRYAIFFPFRELHSHSPHARAPSE